jgi:hypothetical protein
MSGVEPLRRFTPVFIQSSARKLTPFPSDPYLTLATIGIHRAMFKRIRRQFVQSQG